MTEYFLCVDGREITQLGVGFAKKTGDAWVLESFRILKSTPEDFLKYIHAEIERNTYHVDGIVVCRGPGSATALRASLAIVNTMAFTRSIPIYDVASQEKDSREANFCEPIYMYEPNITATKKDVLRRTL